MEFTLFYRGDVLSSGNTKGLSIAKRDHKHLLRNVFAEQLARLRGTPSSIFHATQLVTVLDKQIKFWPMVSSRNGALAEIAITMLRPEPPGSIIYQGGDLDNRLKTILDALRIPTPSELPQSAIAELAQEGRVFQCVLEDDRLITGVSVKTDRLLDRDPTVNSHEVVTLIKVRIDYSRTPNWLKG